MSDEAVRRSIDGVWRVESARLIAGLVRMVKDVGLAEDLAQDALVAALETWPGSGIPDNPGAWLMRTARRRAIDRIRRDRTAERKYGMLGYELEQAQAAAPDLDGEREPIERRRQVHVVGGADGAVRGEQFGGGRRRADPTDHVGAEGVGGLPAQLGGEEVAARDVLGTVVDGGCGIGSGVVRIGRHGLQGTRRDRQERSAATIGR